MAPKAIQKDPRAIAAAAADEYFAALVTNPDISDAFEDMHTPLDSAIEEIANLLEAKRVRDHGPITPDQDLVRWDIGVKCGYTIGVQVGMRLRASGGVR